MGLSQYGPWAFIAGGSEGVGASFARLLAAGGINVVIAARKPEPIQALAAELRNEFGVEVREMAINLSAPDMLERVLQVTHDIEVGMLICNAGAENSLTAFLERKPGRAEMLIALNVTMPTQLAYHFGAGMRTRRRGGIIIVGSNSCHTGAPGQVAYSAAKAYQFNFAEGLWAELRPHNVQVLGLILGLTNTPNLARTGYKPDPTAGLVMSEPGDVAQQGLDRLGREPIHCIGGWTERLQKLRGSPRGEAMAMIGRGAAPKG